MGNCLKTQLKESVQNANLLQMGEQRIILKAINNSVGFGINSNPQVTVYFDKPVTIRASRSAASSLIAENVTQYTGYGFGVFPPVNEEVVVKIMDAYPVYNYACYGADTQVFTVDFKNFIPNESMQEIFVKDTTDFNYNINNLKNSPNIQNFICPFAPSICGDIKNLANLQSIQIFDITNCTDVRGDVSALMELSTLQSFMFPKAVLTGNLDVVFNAWAQAGKNNTCSIGIPNGIILNGESYRENPYRTIRFGSSMVNPTSEETARGWQIA